MTINLEKAKGGATSPTCTPLRTPSVIVVSYYYYYFIRHYYYNYWYKAQHFVNETCQLTDVEPVYTVIISNGCVIHFFHKQ